MTTIADPEGAIAMMMTMMMTKIIILSLSWIAAPFLLRMNQVRLRLALASQLAPFLLS